MNYWRAGLTGAVMSIFGTMLCTAKVGTNVRCSADGRVENSVLKYDTFTKTQGDVSHTFPTGVMLENYTEDAKEYTRVTFAKAFNHEAYYKNHLYETSHYWYSGNQWTFTNALVVNALWAIPTSLLSGWFHEAYGKDLTKSVNEYFSCNLSPYLVNAGVFGVVGTIGTMIGYVTKNDHILNDFSQPWIYGMSLMEGFMIGATAGLAAYFGDEDSLPPEIIHSST